MSSETSTAQPLQQPSQTLNPFCMIWVSNFWKWKMVTPDCSLDLTERHMNSWQITHGGVIMTMLDVVMAMAGRSLHEDLKGVVTVEMKASFLQPGGVAGGRIEARGKAFHQSTTMCFCEAKSGMATGSLRRRWERLNICDVLSQVRT
jgi:uncharacterized protein (TIGR00369 family)